MSPDLGQGRVREAGYPRDVLPLVGTLVPRIAELYSLPYSQQRDYFILQNSFHSVPTRLKIAAIGMKEEAPTTAPVPSSLHDPIVRPVQTPSMDFFLRHQPVHAQQYTR